MNYSSRLKLTLCALLITSNLISEQIDPQKTPDASTVGVNSMYLALQRHINNRISQAHEQQTLLPVENETICPFECTQKLKTTRSFNITKGISSLTHSIFKTIQNHPYLTAGAIWLALFEQGQTLGRIKAFGEEHPWSFIFITGLGLQYLTAQLLTKEEAPVQIEKPADKE